MNNLPIVAPVAGVVLAGGGSRRMGSPKAELSFGPGTLLDWTASLLLAAVPEVWVSVARPEADPPVWARGILPDIVPGSGPLGALHSALVTLERPVLLVACDLPFLDPADLRALAETPAEVACLLSDEGGPQPLAALYTPSLVPQIERRLATGDRSMHGFLNGIPHTLRVAKTRVAGCPPLANLNTPEEYRGAVAAAKGAGLFP